jgi:hypothetical protein
VTSEYVPNSALTDTENSNKEVENLMQWLSLLSQHWEQLLFTTGGAINFQKSHWYLMSWLWKNGIPHLATSWQSPGKLSLTTGYQTLKDIVPRFEPTEGFRMLGVYITPSGKFTKQAKVLREHAESFKDLIQSSSLTGSEAYCCYMMYIHPRLHIPFHAFHWQSSNVGIFRPLF